MEMRAPGAPLGRAEKREPPAFVLPTLQVVPLCQPQRLPQQQIAPPCPGQSLYIHVPRSGLSLKIGVVPRKRQCIPSCSLTRDLGSSAGSSRQHHGEGGMSLLGCHCTRGEERKDKEGEVITQRVGGMSLHFQGAPRGCGHMGMCNTCQGVKAPTPGLLRTAANFAIC